LQYSLQCFLLCELAHLAQNCVALLLASNSPTGIAINNQIFMRDENGLLKERVAVFRELQKPFVGWP
jgi:hypothetical protein